MCLKILRPDRTNMPNGLQCVDFFSIRPLLVKHVTCFELSLMRMVNFTQYEI